jgi:saccharopine dehydrogenase-like NADP-dependent oxidoreductase
LRRSGNSLLAWGDIARVLALGGAGGVGLYTVPKLAVSDLVSEIAIAGRNLEAAKLVAAGLGGKGTAMQVDILNETMLASLAAGFDIIVNTAGPEYKIVLPALRAAIKAGVNYCDICCLGRTTEQALTLDAAAKAADVTALMGIGVEGLSNLMMMHASRQLDKAEGLRYCIVNVIAAVGGDPEAVLAQYRRLGKTDASMQLVMRSVAGKVPAYRDGRWIDVDPIEDAVRINSPYGGEFAAHPVDISDTITLPRALPDIRSVSVVLSMYPPELNKIWCELGRRIARGELDESAAAVEFVEHMTTLPKDVLATPKGYESAWVTWAEAVGTKQGRRVCYKCWPSVDWTTTAGPLATAALKILRGEIRTRGVLSPESCLDPMSFFAEAAQYGAQKPLNGRLLNESFEVLDKG